MTKGSPTPELQDSALWIHKAARRATVDLKVVWRRRNDPRLKLADDWSRAVDVDSYGLSPKDFECIQRGGGKCDMDMFASEENFSYRNIRFIVSVRNSLPSKCLHTELERGGVHLSAPPRANHRRPHQKDRT